MCVCEGFVLNLTADGYAVMHERPYILMSSKMFSSNSGAGCACAAENDVTSMWTEHMYTERD